MAAETLTFPNDHTPLDLLLFRRYGREVPGLVEATLNTNPGLALLGPFSPRGTRIFVQPPGPPPTVTARPLVRLFD